MKVKNFREMRQLFDKNFTGILEWCDGVDQSCFVVQIRYTRNGLLHRENGIAIDRIDGLTGYWLNDKSYPEKQWKIEVEKLRKSMKGSFK